jgi:tRNA threonylcarbamoyladenosine biosynthesis protein TsaB
LTRILAIDTSSAWCSVALSLGDEPPFIKHEPVSAGASQLLLPWVNELFTQAKISLQDLDAIAVGVGPGAFTGVRLGVAAVQGLAIAAKIPVIPVASLDAIAAQLVHTNQFISASPKNFIVAIDARMDEVYWAHYQVRDGAIPKRLGEIHLSKPEALEFDGVEYVAGSALKEFGDRLFSSTKSMVSKSQLEPDISVSALGILEFAKAQWISGHQIDVHLLEPLYIRNKVALTTLERLENLQSGSHNV